MVAAATARDALSAATTALTAAGCETPRLDAELLIADAAGVDRARLLAEPGLELAGPAARLASERIRRRVMREPVAYILGRKGFRHIEVQVDSRVLIPRPETELLVDIAIELADGASVHEVGTGSGAVALALLDERGDLRVTASDASPAAVEVARANAARLRLPLEVEVRRGAPPGGFDLILANLPYVREDEWSSLQPEITRFEPREALVAGRDGLDAIRECVAGVEPGTRVALEHAPAQAQAVRGMLREADTRRDLAGLERVTVGRAP